MLFNLCGPKPQNVVGKHKEAYSVLILQHLTLSLSLFLYAFLFLVFILNPSGFSRKSINVKVLSSLGNQIYEKAWCIHCHFQCLPKSYLIESGGEKRERIFIVLYFSLSLGRKDFSWTSNIQDRGEYCKDPLGTAEWNERQENGRGNFCFSLQTKGHVY